MARRIPARLMPHGGLVRYRVAAGHSGQGPIFGAPVTPERACIQEDRKLVRSSASEQVSSAFVWLDPEHHVPVGSEVDIWYGTARARTCTVLTSTYHEHGQGLPAHVELALT